MKFRQALITIENPASNRVMKAIMYRQPFNRLGLDFTFSFTKTYGQITSNVELEIFNAAPETVELFNFNPRALKNRPLIRIYAGYSSAMCKTYDDWKLLKHSLPLLFSGYPYFLSDKNLANGRVLKIQLTDKTALLDERQSRYIGLFQAGVSVYAILQTLSAHSQESFDLTRVSFLQNQKIENSLFFSGQHIFSYILPLLGGRYGFTFTVNPNGGYIFYKTDNKIQKPTAEISIDNGLVEQPERLNWTQWSFKTFFGLPNVFFAGDWVKLKSEAIKGFGVSARGEVTGLITEASYNFDDTAFIEYIIAADGIPAGSSLPIVEV